MEVDVRDFFQRLARGSAPWGLLGMVCLVIAIELFVERHDLDCTAAWYADRRLTAHKLPRFAPECQILCFGDSTLKLGLAPRVIEDVLGKRAYNFAIHAGQPPADYVLLRRAISAGARPSALIIGHSPSFLNRPATINARVWSELIGLWDCFDVGKGTWDAGFFASVVLGRIVPSLRARDEIRANVMKALRGEEIEARKTIPALWRNWNQNRGAQIMPQVTLNSTKTVPEFSVPTWSCNRTNALYFERFFALAAERRIPVFWLILPIAPHIQAASDRSGYDAQFTRFVAVMHSRFPNVVVIDGRHAGYDERTLTDVLHLNGRGAVAFSTAVASIIGKRLSDPGQASSWVTLRSYRECPSSSVEHLDESVAAVQKPGSGMRR
jgi:hypothetical protein